MHVCFSAGNNYRVEIPLSTDRYCIAILTGGQFVPVPLWALLKAPLFPCCLVLQKQVVEQIWFLLLGGLGLAFSLDIWAGHPTPTILLLSIFGSLVSYIYSAPPLKLKQNGWAGNYALGSSYISLPWWCGQAMFGELNIQAREVIMNSVCLTPSAPHAESASYVGLCLCDR